MNDYKEPKEAKARKYGLGRGVFVYSWGFVDGGLCGTGRPRMGTRVIHEQTDSITLSPVGPRGREFINSTL
jgi:hypothetical protein